MNRFEGKSALVTGASGGIGEACARKLVAEGARVVLAARNEGALNQLVDELGADAAQAVPTDVSDLGACKRLVESAIDRFGAIDLLVNNAGHNSRGPLEDIEMDTMLQMLDVNLRGPMMLSKLVLPHMRARDTGSIVNVASLAGRFPLDDEATYSATKFGLRIFSFALAEELRNTNVRVSVVSPGPVETSFILAEGIIETVPPIVFSQPMSTADEIADLVLACALDGARERTKPILGAKLATMAYLFPGMRRSMIPALERKGRAAKKKYLERRSR